MPTLPDVKAKFVVDYSSLTAAEKASAKAHGEFQAGAKASTTHTLRFQQSLTTLMDHFGGMPPIVNQAGRSLESMASQGVTGMGLLGGAALAAVGAVVEVVGQSVKSYTELGDKVENYKRVVGGSAEESGRMVQTFQALGVGADTATQGMFKLSKAIETAPKKLADLGIEIAKDAKGNVDLSKTLFNVADAYNATTDPAKRNLILFDAFGKSGKDMIPVLEQGSVALQKLEAAAQLTFTDADLQRLKDFKIHSAEAKQSWDAMWQSIGQNFIPTMDNATMAYLANDYAMRKITAAQDAGTLSRQLMGNALGKIVGKYEEEYYAAQKVKTALDSQAQSTRDAAAANDTLWTSLDKVIGQEEAQVNAGFAKRRADMAVEESQGLVNTAMEAYNAAVAKFGINSDDAYRASENVSTALINQQEAYYRDAAAARKLQEDTDLATTGQKDAKLEAEAYIGQLQKEADSLAPGSDLRKNLQEYIDKLKTEIPREITTTLHISTVAVDRNAARLALLGFAEGGRPPVGVPSLVGEKGPEIWTPDVPGTITPHGGTPPAPPGETKHYNLTLVGTPAVNDPDGVRRMLQRMESLGQAT